MQKKKILCLVLAVSMLLGSALTAFATEDGENYDISSNNLGVTVTGNGEVEYVNTVVYSVTLPTSKALTLKVDPQGLLNMTGNTATEKDLAANAGKVWATTKPVISNRGSVPTKVTVALTLTGDANPVKSETAVTVSGNNAAEATNILLYAVPSAVDVKGDAANYSASTTGIVMEKKTAAEVSFILDPAEYEFKKTVSDNNTTFSYSLQDEGDKGHGTALSFEGLVNKYADWSDYVEGAEDPKTIGLTAVFTFTHSLDATTDVADNTAGAPYGMVAYGGDKVTVVATTTTISGSAYSRSSKTNTYTISWASAMEETDKTIKSISVASDSTTVGATMSANAYSLNLDSNTLTIDGTLSVIASGAVGQTRYLTVTFGDNSTAMITVTVSA